MLHFPDWFAMGSVSHGAVLVLIFHNQGGARLLTISRIPFIWAVEARRLIRNLAFSKVCALVPPSESRTPSFDLSDDTPAHRCKGADLNTALSHRETYRWLPVPPRRSNK